MKKSILSSLEMLNPLFDKLAKLTKKQRILICVGMVILLVAPVVYFVFMPKHQKIDQLTSQYESLTTELEKYKRRASQLSKYKAEIKEVEAQFKVASRALPENEEIPKLLTSISKAGQTSNLEFLLFKPQKEYPQGFYAELPVSIQVIGKFHDIVAFFYRVGELSRIVNIKDITMNTQSGDKNKKNSGENLLKVSCTAMTYKFIEKKNEPENGKNRR